eukprot:gnl/MRDRNA2_/MRDRNA2_83796_c0_seq1.p1 gnl/MRDRNA2_/MRDRNA2_83796_c0~~gnl/MRDRNA2_/MRDRNA2_83796_c0_seq1.p1  ORF type:complete len:494 (-),score=69.57 gnl/MRDRNA2_/MRDRNA2_83796_c0_seq1:252-1733(-)
MLQVWSERWKQHRDVFSRMEKEQSKGEKEKALFQKDHDSFSFPASGDGSLHLACDQIDTKGTSHEHQGPRSDTERLSFGLFCDSDDGLPHIFDNSRGMQINNPFLQSSGLRNEFVHRVAIQVDSGVNHVVQGPPQESSYGLLRDSTISMPNSIGIQSRQDTAGINLALEASRVVGQHGIEITNLIGSTNASQVFHATGPRDMGSIAVKVLSLQKGKHTQSEFDLLKDIKHPNITQIFAVLHGPPLCYLMEYCSGGDLFHALHSSRKCQVKPVPLSYRSRLSIACDVASALAYLHSKSILHRDTKSANVLFAEPVTDTNKTPVAKLADFGLSKVPMPINPCGVGTIRWMAPDVLEGAYTLSSDVYSFSILLWEILSGKIPFARMKADKELVLRISNGLRPDVSECSVAKGSWEILSLMERCWYEVPSERPSMPKIHSILCIHLDNTVDSADRSKLTLDTSGGSTHVDESRASLDANDETLESWGSLDVNLGGER